MQLYSHFLVQETEASEVNLLHCGSRIPTQAFTMALNCSTISKNHRNEKKNVKRRKDGNSTNILDIGTE